jgi:SAM-dependent methyltransferase
MNQQVNTFYEELAEYYHLIFEDWDSSIKRQAAVLNKLLTPEAAGKQLKILDCACGIGTQSIGLAISGHRVVGSDLSEAAVLRARNESQRRGLTIPFCVSDMTSLREITEGSFDVAIAMDNALPHLTADQLKQAARTIASKLRPGGLFLATTRDYDALILEKPAVQGPVFYGAPGYRRIVHQIWDWDAYAGEGSGNILHVYITVESEEGWRNHHFVSTYRCLLRQELTEALANAGFVDVRWLMPSETGSYQPMVWARVPA